MTDNKVQVNNGVEFMAGVEQLQAGENTRQVGDMMAKSVSEAGGETKRREIIYKDCWVFSVRDFSVYQECFENLISGRSGLHIHQ